MSEKPEGLEPPEMLDSAGFSAAETQGELGSGSLFLLEHFDSPDLYQAVEEAFSRLQEVVEAPKQPELGSLIGMWCFDIERGGFLLDYQAASLLGYKDYYRRYSIEEISLLLCADDAQKLFFDFLNPDSGDVILENIMLQQGPYQGERLVVQGSIMQRDENTGQVVQALGSICYEHSAPASYITRELTGDGIFYINTEQDLFITSSTYQSMLGYINGELPDHLSQFVEQIVHPDDWDNLEIHRHVMASADYGDIWSCCLRLKHKDGRYIWTIGRGLVLKRDQNGKALIIVGSRCDIDLIHQNFDNMQQLLFNDNLTGLYNRTYFEQNVVTYSEDSIQPVSVLFLDVTGLKVTNDILGHGYGDFLLLKLSELLLIELLHFMRDLRRPSVLAALEAAEAAEVAKAAETAAAAGAAATATVAETAPATEAADAATAQRKKQYRLPAFVLNRNFERLVQEFLEGLQEKIQLLLASNGIPVAHNSNKPLVQKAALRDEELAAQAQTQGQNKLQYSVLGSEVSNLTKDADRSLHEVLLKLPQVHHERISQLLAENATLLRNADMAQSDPLIWALVETALHGREHPSLKSASEVDKYIHTRFKRKSPVTSLQGQSHLQQPLAPTNTQGQVAASAVSTSAASSSASASAASAHASAVSALEREAQVQANTEASPDRWGHMSPVETFDAKTKSERSKARRDKAQAPTQQATSDLLSSSNSSGVVHPSQEEDKLAVAMAASHGTGISQEVVVHLSQGVPAVMRLSGDEFMVLLPHCPAIYGREFLRRIREASKLLNDSYCALPINQRPEPLCFGIGLATVGENGAIAPDAPAGLEAHAGSEAHGPTAHMAAANPAAPVAPAADTTTADTALDSPEEMVTYDSLLKAVERADLRMQADKEQFHERHLQMLKDYFEAKLERTVSMRDERRQILLSEQERELLRNGQLEQNLVATINEMEFEA